MCPDSFVMTDARWDRWWMRLSNILSYHGIQGALLVTESVTQTIAFLTGHLVAWYVHLLAPLIPLHLPCLLAPFTSLLTVFKSSLTPLTSLWDTETYRFVFMLKTHSKRISRKRKHTLTRPARFQIVPGMWNIGWREIGWYTDFWMIQTRGDKN